MWCSEHVQTSMSEDSFWISINILINKPHVINKRLWGCKTLIKYDCSAINITPWFPHKQPKVFSLNDINSSIMKAICDLGLHYPSKSDAAFVEIMLLELLPKTYTDSHAFQLVCLDKNDLKVYFFNVTPANKVQQTLCPEFSFYLRLNNKIVTLTANCDENLKAFQWLCKTVLPQFVKWGEKTVDKKHLNNQESLSLVDNDEYYTKYNELKNKYGKEMVKIWPECTDPSKFVYEDVAIATFLLLLWEDERKKQETKRLQTFVDLGCGNGLLVYILSMEGHQGVGLDVRKRQIWDIYPKNVKLEEKAIVPSDLNLFPETDWIIGNHSDELTPWIPVIAARSSYKCRFFLLPCCAYNFDGSKYLRQNSSKSQYTEYLEYIKSLCKKCGFETNVDRLKIPSTKRICLVGHRRTYPVEEHNKYCHRLHSLINNETNSNEICINKTDLWITDFKARDRVEKVRNCTQIEKGLIEAIVNCITKYLLKDCNTDVTWSPGKIVDILELVNVLSQDDLKSLKSECGGLQTLMRNHHHIFKVQGGKVQLRHPKSIAEINIEIEKNKSKAQNIKIQQKPCWFYNNHPQGCPLSKDNCSYLHIHISAQ